WIRTPLHVAVVSGSTVRTWRGPRAQKLARGRPTMCRRGCPRRSAGNSCVVSPRQLGKSLHETLHSSVGAGDGGPGLVPGVLVTGAAEETVQQAADRLHLFQMHHRLLHDDTP